VAAAAAVAGWCVCVCRPSLVQSPQYYLIVCHTIIHTCIPTCCPHCKHNPAVPSQPPGGSRASSTTAPRSGAMRAGCCDYRGCCCCRVCAIAMAVESPPRDLIKPKSSS
jgi:hypothetical protein